MAKTIQLLKQLRRASLGIAGATDNAAFKALLAAADVALNTLQQQESPTFYLRYLADGSALLQEGRALAAQHGASLSSATSSRPDLSLDTRMDVLDSEIHRLHKALGEVVTVLDEQRSVAEKAFLVRMSDWESNLYQHNFELAAEGADRATPAITSIALQTYLTQRFPERKNLTVTNFAVLDGGFSKKTILFETQDTLFGSQSMVMRAEQPIDILRYEGSDVTQEFYMIQLMREAGLPIAEPLWLESDRRHLGTRFIVSRKADGKTYGGNLGSNEAPSPELVRSMVSTFIHMHSIKIDSSNPLAQKSHLKEWLPCRDSLQATIHYTANEFLPRLMRLTDIPVSPQLVRGIKWLQDNIPDTGDEAPVIVHIDFALNNLIINGDRITAVLDWESSRFGDPAEDIIWTQQNIAAYISLPELLQRYKAGTGRDISPRRLAYARIAKCALNAITCMSAMRALDKEDNANINCSILGYKYMSLFGAQFNSLIAAAESETG